MKRNYKTERELINELEKLNIPGAFLKEKLEKLKIQFKTAKNLGYDPSYIIEGERENILGMEITPINIYVEAPYKNLEDKIRIIHSHQNLDEESIMRLIKLRSKR